MTSPPDPPPAPEPAPVHDQSFEQYLIHRYCHLLCKEHPGCPWCAGCAICLAIDRGNPFGLLGGLTLR
jgi:hypothetical protein